MAKQKRKLFDELKQGIKEIKAHNQGKITLRTHTFKKKPHFRVDAAVVRDTREQLRLSRAVFALRLRISPRTLEKWEQGKTAPNDQAAAIILMIRKYDDTLDRLESI